MFNFQSKGISSIGIIVIIVVVLLVGGGLYFYLQQQTPETPSGLLEQEQEEEPIVGEQEEEESTDEQGKSDSVCDNYDCLIAATSQCEPISVTISYSGIPNPIFPDFSMSGQNKYEIKKSSGINDCILTISSPVAVFSISKEGRENLLAQGMTDAEINVQLQTMNESLKSIADMETICPSNASIISAYLTDVKNLNLTDVNAHFSSESGQTVVTYTLSTGQELVCTNEPR